MSGGTLPTPSQMVEVGVLQDQLTISKASKAEPSFCRIFPLVLVYNLGCSLVCLLVLADSLQGH